MLVRLYKLPATLSCLPPQLPATLAATRLRTLPTIYSHITSFTSPARPDFTRLCCQRLDHPPPLVGRVPFVMSSNAQDDMPMEQTVTEEPTGTASGGSKSPVVPGAFIIPTTPVSVQDGDESRFQDSQ